MKSFWDALFSLDDELSIWVEEDDLGREKAIYHRNKRYFVKIPPSINQRQTLRLRGLGKKRGKKNGDLFLHVWLNKGEDTYTDLWISDTSARTGGDKVISINEKKITMIIPPGSHAGLTIRLKGYGREAYYDQDSPPLIHKKRGNLFVRLLVYPDTIMPRYGSFDALSTENMALEGWVYRKIDEITGKMGRVPFDITPVSANTIADTFNENGWKGIYHFLVKHLGLSNTNIELTKSKIISTPGSYERATVFRNNTFAGYNYKITVDEKFLSNPFCVAAILVHELCHIVYSERVDKNTQQTGFDSKNKKASLEEERTVDLLTFMFKVGEFQLRVARDERLTFGYFNQEIFERMQVIVGRKFH